MRRAAVLLSGGVDSTVALAMLFDQPVHIWVFEKDTQDLYRTTNGRRNEQASPTIVQS